MATPALQQDYMRSEKSFNRTASSQNGIETPNPLFIGTPFIYIGKIMNVETMPTSELGSCNN